MCLVTLSSEKVSSSFLVGGCSCGIGGIGGGGGGNGDNDNEDGNGKCGVRGGSSFFFLLCLVYLVLKADDYGVVKGLKTCKTYICIYIDIHK